MFNYLYHSVIFIKHQIADIIRERTTLKTHKTSSSLKFWRLVTCHTDFKFGPQMRKDMCESVRSIWLLKLTYFLNLHSIMKSCIKTVTETIFADIILLSHQSLLHNRGHVIALDPSVDNHITLNNLS